MVCLQILCLLFQQFVLLDEAATKLQAVGAGHRLGRNPCLILRGPTPAPEFAAFIFVIISLFLVIKGTKFLQNRAQNRKDTHAA